MRIFTTHFNAIDTSALLIASFNLQAGAINSRTDLNNLLGDNQVLENTAVGVTVFSPCRRLN